MAASGQPSDKPGLRWLDGRFAQMQEQHKAASPGLAALALKSGNSLLKTSICIRVAISRESGRRGHGVSISNQLSNDGDLPLHRNHTMMGGARVFYQSICSANSENTGTVEMSAGAPDALASE